jgi:hypothetical protein
LKVVVVFQSVAMPLAGSELMRADQPSVRRFVVGILFVAGATSVALAGDNDDVGPKLRTAWQKYSEYLDMSFAYNGRAEIAGEIDQIAAYREKLLTSIRNTQITVDGFPRRRNNLEEEVVQQLLAMRRELTAVDHRLAELRSYLKQMDELALRQAEMSGQPAKPTNRRDLLRESQRLEKECIQAFGALKGSADSSATETDNSRDQVVINAMSSVPLSREEQAQLVPRSAFVAAFKRFCTSKRVSDPAKGKTKSATKKRKSGL